MLVIYVPSLCYAEPNESSTLDGIEMILLYTEMLEGVELPIREPIAVDVSSSGTTFSLGVHGATFAADKFVTADRDPSTIADLRKALTALRDGHHQASRTISIDTPELLANLPEHRVSRSSVGEYERAAFDVGGLVQTALDALIQRTRELAAITPALVDGFAGVKVQNHRIGLAQYTVDGEYQFVLRCSVRLSPHNQYSPDLIVPFSRIPKPGGSQSPARCVLASVARFLREGAEPRFLREHAAPGVA